MVVFQLSEFHGGVDDSAELRDEALWKELFKISVASVVWTGTFGISYDSMMSETSSEVAGRKSEV